MSRRNIVEQATKFMNLVEVGFRNFPSKESCQVAAFTSSVPPFFPKNFKEVISEAISSIPDDRLLSYGARSTKGLEVRDASRAMFAKSGFDLQKTDLMFCRSGHDVPRILSKILPAATLPQAAKQQLLISIPTFSLIPDRFIKELGYQAISVVDGNCGTEAYTENMVAEISKMRNGGIVYMLSPLLTGEYLSAEQCKRIGDAINQSSAVSKIVAVEDLTLSSDMEASNTIFQYLDKDKVDALAFQSLSKVIAPSIGVCQVIGSKGIIQKMIVGPSLENGSPRDHIFAEEYAPSLELQAAVALYFTKENAAYKEHIENLHNLYEKNFEVVKQGADKINAVLQNKGVVTEPAIKLVSSACAGSTLIVDCSNMRGLVVKKNNGENLVLQNSVDVVKFVSEAGVGIVPGEFLGYDSEEMKVRISVGKSTELVKRVFDEVLPNFFEERVVGLQKQGPGFSVVSVDGERLAQENQQTHK